MPALMRTVYGPTLLGLRVAALLASLMAGFAGNLSGFAAGVDARGVSRPAEAGTHRTALHCGFPVGGDRVFCACGAGGVGGSAFGDLMEFLQMVVSLFYGPLLAVVLAAFLRRRTSERQACAGMVLGSATALAIHFASAGGTLFGSSMAANFYSP